MLIYTIRLAKEEPLINTCTCTRKLRILYGTPLFIRIDACMAKVYIPPCIPKTSCHADSHFKQTNDMTSTPIAVVGGTGLVVSVSDWMVFSKVTDTFQGSHILQQLIFSPRTSCVNALMRRNPTGPIDDPDSKLKPLVSTDTSTWPATLSTTTSTILFSALGSTRADSGSFEAQRKIDFDLNLAVARAAKESGVKTYVLISSAGASTASRFPYMQMKAELEDAVVALDFDKTVILRPGLIIGGRERSRMLEQPLHYVANFFGAISGGKLKNSWAQDADVIARAAVRVGMGDSVWEGLEKKIWTMTQADIVAMGTKQEKFMEST